jgi:hypothetical protein
MPVDKVEWMVGYVNDNGAFVSTSDGAQSVFSRSAAEKFSKRLGEKWGLFHYETLLSPSRHEQFIEAQNKAQGTWGGKWGK